MNTEQRLQQLEEEVRALNLAQRDFLTTRIEERDVRIEGILGIRTIKMYTGSGVPAMGAPTGSIYFRTDGTDSNTLYVREAGVWRRVAKESVIPSGYLYSSEFYYHVDSYSSIGRLDLSTMEYKFEEVTSIFRNRAEFDSIEDPFRNENSSMLIDGNVLFYTKDVNPSFDTDGTKLHALDITTGDITKSPEITTTRSGCVNYIIGVDENDIYTAFKDDKIGADDVILNVFSKSDITTTKSSYTVVGFNMTSLCEHGDYIYIGGYFSSDAVILRFEKSDVTLGYTSFDIFTPSDTEFGGTNLYPLTMCVSGNHLYYTASWFVSSVLYVSVLRIPLIDLSAEPDDYYFDTNVNGVSAISSCADNNYLYIGGYIDGNERIVRHSLTDLNSFSVHADSSTKFFNPFIKMDTTKTYLYFNTTDTYTTARITLSDFAGAITEATYENTLDVDGYPYSFTL